MPNDERTEAIGERYGALAESSCCLSCGGAARHADPRPGDICLDLGSGRGQDVLRLAAAVGRRGFCWGVDVSDGMLERARRNAAKLGVGNVGFLKSSLERIPLPDASVDLVVSNCTINHAADKDAVWAEIRRVLRPGGRFVVSDIYAVAEVPEEFRSDPRAVAECWAGAVPREVYLASVGAAGLAGLEVLEESAPYEKGRIHVASITLAGSKPGGCGCGGKGKE
ncbi:MAG: methyltransferase domain-containing protein [Deltaproteobacteria bacterium]|nr:methyltransferase domain-containing protein [Deltaproteobacteria bacterium]